MHRLVAGIIDPDKVRVDRLPLLASQPSDFSLLLGGFKRLLGAIADRDPQEAADDIARRIRLGGQSDRESKHRSILLSDC